MYLEVGFITCAFILANTTVFLAVGIMCFTYSLMLWKLKRDKSRFQRVPRTASEMENIRKTGKRTSSRDKMVRMETRITKMFLVVMAAVLGCYGPSAILIYTMSFCESCSCESLHWMRDLQCLFVLMNSSVNFFCYGLRSPRFRQAFVAILRLPARGKLSGNPGSTSSPSASESQPMRCIHKPSTDV